MNARTSEKWFYESSGHIVRGRKIWLSPPLKVVDKASQGLSPSSALDDKGHTGEGYSAKLQQNAHADPSEPPLSGYSGAKGPKYGRLGITVLVLVLLLLFGVAVLVWAGGTGWGYFLSSLWLSRTVRLLVAENGFVHIFDRSLPPYAIRLPLYGLHVRHTLFVIL